MSQSEIVWNTSVFTFDDLPVTPEMLAAYIVSLKYLPNGGRPSWLITSNSDGRNLFGRLIAGKSLLVGWVSRNTWRRNLGSLQKLRRATTLPRPIVRHIAEQLEQQLHTQLYNSAYVPMIERTSSLCRPDLAFHDHLLGPERSGVMDALMRLHGMSGLFEEIHQTVMYSRVTLPSNPESASPHIADWQAAPPRVGCRLRTPHVQTIAFPRPFCDTVYTIVVPPISMQQFATAGQILRALTTEFRRTLWRRGGIYAAGLHVSVVKRTLSWWTHLDHHPGSTYELARSLAEVSRTLQCIPHCPERALAHFPPRPPRWPGQKTAPALMWTWGLRDADWDDLPRAGEHFVDVAEWLHATGESAFCACGPARELDAFCAGGASGGPA